MTKLKKRLKQFFLRESSISFSLIAIIVILTVLCEAYLTHRMYIFFGEQSHNFAFALSKTIERFIYFVESIIYDGFFYWIIFVILIRICFLLRLNPLQRNYVATLIILSFIGSVFITKWELFEYFSTRFDLGILKELVEGKLSNIFIWISFGSLAWLFVGLFILCITLWPIVLLRSQGRDIAYWRLSWHASLYTMFATIILIVNHFALIPYESIRFGLSNKVSYWLIDTLFTVTSDFDGDGFGPFTVPKDPDNLDSKINPYAIDVPLDGIDQDHLAGDLVEIDPFVKKAGFPKLDPNKAKKNVIIIVVETFRVDVAEDPAVMPFINTLVRDHNTFTTVYSNYGVTSRAIQSIFFGRLSYTTESRSLFDEFRDNGYLTFGVSAQSENWGNTASILKFDRLTRYYDVRNKKFDEVTLTPYQKQKGELAVFLDSHEVNETVFNMINEAKDHPFFMYINYQDLHYPYFSDKTEKVLVDEYHDEAWFFKPNNRAAILRQYQNDAIHLDKSFRELFDFLTHKGIANNTIVLIVGDHPDSFYENGLTGHAWSVDEHQRRTPLIIVNGRGQWDLPLGQDELAKIIVESANYGDQRTSLLLRHNPLKYIFELTGTLEAPRQIAWINAEDLMTYDFKLDRWQPGTGLESIRSDELMTNSPKYAQYKLLINRWESEQFVRAQLSASQH